MIYETVKAGAYEQATRRFSAAGTLTQRWLVKLIPARRRWYRTEHLRRSREKCNARLDNGNSNHKDFIWYILKQQEKHDLKRDEVRKLSSGKVSESQLRGVISGLAISHSAPRRSPVQQGLAPLLTVVPALILLLTIALFYLQVVVNSALFIVAGSETTANLLSGLFARLIWNTDKYKKLTDEIRSAFQNESDINDEALKKLPYMNACIEEGLRIHPPVPTGLLRTVPKGGDTIDGMWVPGGTSVAVGK